MRLRKRHALAGLGLALACLFLGDLAMPSLRRRPGPFREPRPLTEILPQLPARNTGRLGKTGDPLNMIFLGTEEQVRGALTEAGWTNIPLGIPASLRAGLKEIATLKPLRAGLPMNLYTIEGRYQDLNWTQPITPIAKRHHFRMWHTHWRDEKGRELWWSAGNFDLAVRWWDLSHVPDPDNDSERDFVGASLKGSRWVERLRYEAVPQIPREGRNDKGYPFRTDGRALVVELKTPPKDRGRTPA